MSRVCSASYSFPSRHFTNKCSQCLGSMHYHIYNCCELLAKPSLNVSLKSQEASRQCPGYINQISTHRRVSSHRSWKKIYIYTYIYTYIYIYTHIYIYILSYITYIYIYIKVYIIYIYSIYIYIYYIYIIYIYIYIYI